MDGPAGGTGGDAHGRGAGASAPGPGAPGHPDPEAAAPSGRYSARDYWGDDVTFPAFAGSDLGSGPSGLPDETEALEPALGRIMGQMRAEVRDRAGLWLGDLGPGDQAFLSPALPADREQGGGGAPGDGPGAGPPRAAGPDPAVPARPEAPRPRPLTLPGLESLTGPGAAPPSRRGRRA